MSLGLETWAIYCPPDPWYATALDWRYAPPLFCLYSSPESPYSPIAPPIRAKLNSRSLPTDSELQNEIYIYVGGAQMLVLFLKLIEFREVCVFILNHERR
jgi:hypothetical protein